MMKSKFLKGRSLALAFCTMIAFGNIGMIAKAATTNDIVVASSQIKHIDINIKETIDFAKKVDKALTITPTKVIFDAKKAKKAGLSDAEVADLINYYDDMNLKIDKNEYHIINIGHGRYDVSANNTIVDIPKDEVNPSIVKTDRMFQKF